MNTLVRFALAVTVAGVLCSCRSRPAWDADATKAPGGQSSPRPAATTAPGNSYRIPDSLAKLNQLFRDGYSERLAAVRTNITPLIVADFSTVVLYWHGTAETNRCIPDVYQALKVVDHVPFGIYLRVEPCAAEQANPQLPDAVVQALTEYRAEIDEATVVLASAGFSQRQLERQRRILHASRDYVTNVIATATAPRGQLLAFARAMGPLLLENANEAAAAQLDMTHAAVMKWKKRIPPADWSRLVVVVRGLHMPRRMNIFTQYFAKVLHEPSRNLGYPLESRRLIYAEFIPTGRDYFDLMATTFIDGDASEAFFGDHWRMSRDVLADGAEQHLKTLRF